MNAQFIQDTPFMIWKHPESGIKVILDPGDNILNKTTEHGAYEYTYDDLSRMTVVDNPSQYDDEEYAYDNVGNRLTSADTTGSWAYNQNNELGGYDTTSFVYDDNGNMVQKTVDGVVTSYVYNVEDRLAEVWDGEAGNGTLIATYYYDPFGRRLWKEVGGTRTYYHYADEGLIGEYDSAGSEIKTYGYKPNSMWTTDPLFMKEGTSYYFYHNDHLGTPQKMTGVNGAVVWSAKYSSFGKAEVDAASTVTNNLRFPGQYEDAETGLNYNFNRYYDSISGRYLREDPLKLSIIIFKMQSSYISLYKTLPKRYDNNDLENFTYSNFIYNHNLSSPQTLNNYLYATNNPVLFIDPNGLLSTRCWVQLGLGIFHTLEGAVLSTFGATLPVLAYAAIGPAGLLTAPAAYAYLRLGILEFEIGTHHLDQIIRGECDPEPHEDPCASIPERNYL